MKISPKNRLQISLYNQLSIIIPVYCEDYNDEQTTVKGETKHIYTGCPTLQLNRKIEYVGLHTHYLFQFYIQVIILVQIFTTFNHHKL